MINKLLCFMFGCQFSKLNTMTGWFGESYRFLTEYDKCKHCGKSNDNNLDKVQRADAAVQYGCDNNRFNWRNETAGLAGWCKKAPRCTH